MAFLYIVSTPIGNLSDMTHRGVDTLRAVQRVLAEDTRRTAILFKHYGITTPLYSAHEHNEVARVGQILSWLNAGEDLAIVSDAGTPLISDPGARIVQAVIEAGHTVVPIPGASAVLSALVASGIAAEPFTFFGFLARSSRERKEQLADVAATRHTSVLYEAPGRVQKLLEDLMSVCGDDRHVAIARELTKLHETFVRGTLAEVRDHYADQDVRGEIVCILAGAPVVTQSNSEEKAIEMARGLIGAGLSVRDAAKQIVLATGIARNRAYEITQSVSAEGSD